MRRVLRSVRILLSAALVAALVPALAFAEPPAQAPAGGAATGAAPGPAIGPAAPAPAPSIGPAAPPAGGRVTAPPAGVPQGPDIRRFDANRAPVIVGERIHFEWDVTPGLAGGRIVSVEITIGAARAPIASSLPSRGSHDAVLMSFDPRSPTVAYHLTATDSAGRTSTRSVAVPYVTIQQAIQQLQVGLDVRPREFRVGETLQFAVTLGSRYWPMNRIRIKVSAGGRVIRTSHDITLANATMTVPLAGDSFAAATGEYLVEVEYGYKHLEARFRTVQAPYFTLAPVPR